MSCAHEQSRSALALAPPERPRAKAGARRRGQAPELSGETAPVRNRNAAREQTFADGDGAGCLCKSPLDDHGRRRPAGDGSRGLQPARLAYLQTGLEYLPDAHERLARTLGAMGDRLRVLHLLDHETRYSQAVLRLSTVPR